MKIYHHKKEGEYLLTNAKDIFNVKNEEIAIILDFNNEHCYYKANFGIGKSDIATKEYRDDFELVGISFLINKLDIENIHKKIKDSYEFMKENSSEIETLEYLISPSL